MDVLANVLLTIRPIIYSLQLAGIQFVLNGHEQDCVSLAEILTSR